MTLRSIGKLFVPVSLYLSIDDAWSQADTGDAIATMLAIGGVAVGVLSGAIQLSVVTPHPAFKVAIALAGFGLATAAVLTTDDEEQFSGAISPAVRQWRGLFGGEERSRGGRASSR